MNPFSYPDTPHVRRHGPVGYESYSSCRDWLRDEFSFRCVYCRMRESWTQGRTVFHIDHLIPIAMNGNQEYDNLIYCCSTCNSSKRSRQVPNPLEFLLADTIQLNDLGEFVGESSSAKRLIELINLNDADMVAYRRMIFEIVDMAEKINPNLYQKLMGYPADLPDLSERKPPGGDSRPEGITQSFFEKRLRGELPETY